MTALFGLSTTLTGGGVVPFMSGIETSLDGLFVDGLFVGGVSVDGVSVDGVSVDGLFVDGLPVAGAEVSGVGEPPPALDRSAFNPGLVDPHAATVRHPARVSTNSLRRMGKSYGTAFPSGCYCRPSRRCISAISSR